MIRPTFLSFETAKRAVTIGQLGLDTVGHNIANAQTPGYTRQRVDQVSINSAGYTEKYRNFGVQFPGQGADINAISQIRDPYLDNRYRTEATTYGELGVKDVGLTDINNIFDEIQTNGLHAKMGDLYTTIDKLLAQADSKELAMVVRNTAKELAWLINENAGELEKARVGQTEDLKSTVATEVNDILEQIADLNVKIKEDHFYGNPSNELVDDRNVLIDKLSEFMDIKIINTPVQISGDFSITKLSIELKDSGNPPVMLVDSGSFNKLGVEVDDATGDVSIKILEGQSGFKIPVNDQSIKIDVPDPDNPGFTKKIMNPELGDITKYLYKGGIKGYIDIINGVGPNAPTGNTFRGIPYYQASLDEYAAKLADAFNRVNNVTADESKDRSDGLFPETFDKNLFVPNRLTVSKQPASNWIANITPGTVEFSGSEYPVSFAFDGASTVTATFNDGTGRSFTSNVPDPLEAGAKLEFIDSDGAVAFSVTTAAGDPPIKYTDDPPVPGGPNTNNLANIAAAINTPAGESVVIDAKITASNITVSNSWLNDPLYMVATKEKTVTIAKPTLEVAGTPPTWMRAITIPDGSTLTQNTDGDPYMPDGRYQFTLADSSTSSVGTEIAVSVKVGSQTFYAYPSPEVTKINASTGERTVEWSKNSSISFYDASAGGPPPPAGATAGFIISSSSTPALSTTDSKLNILEVKNVTAAANDNIFKFKELFTETNSYSNAAYSGTFEGYLINMQSDAALDKQLNASNLNSSTVVIGTLADRRDAISAVSVDEEGINMMTYQNAYNAAARYMTTLDEALETIINGMGRVGR